MKKSVNICENGRLNYLRVMWVKKALIYGLLLEGQIRKSKYIIIDVHLMYIYMWFLITIMTDICSRCKYIGIHMRV